MYIAVQRSSCPNFKSDVQTEVVPAGHVLSHQITGLKKGVCCYFTVQAGNIKGFGAPSPVLRYVIGFGNLHVCLSMSLLVILLLGYLLICFFVCLFDVHFVSIFVLHFLYLILARVSLSHVPGTYMLLIFLPV